MLFITALFAVLLATLVPATPAALLPCSAVSGTPCACPEGTELSESSTVKSIGASASNVRFLLNDFSQTAWTGNDPMTLEGPNNVPVLSLRERNLSTLVGNYLFKELLTFRYESPFDGSFEQRFEQRGFIPYHSGNGSFSGLWTTLKGDRIFENQTLVQTITYACQTGHPMNFAAYYGSALTNATNILRAAGLISGVSTGPESVQLF